MPRCVNVFVTPYEYWTYTSNDLSTTSCTAIVKGTYQPISCMILNRTFISLLVVTTKLLRVVPREFSKIDDHLGCSRLI